MFIQLFYDYINLSTMMLFALGLIIGLAYHIVTRRLMIEKKLELELFKEQYLKKIRKYHVDKQEKFYTYHE